MKKYYIWSNFVTTSENVQKYVFEDDSVHIFLNTCKPYRLAKDKFSNNEKYCFLRRVGKSNKCLDVIINTGNSFYNVFKEVFLVQDLDYRNIFKLIQPYNLSDLSNTTKISFDNLIDLNDQVFKDNSKWGRTTGFASVIFSIQLFNISFQNIVLVNFNRKDSQKTYNDLYVKNHNIDIEEDFYKRNNIKNIII